VERHSDPGIGCGSFAPDRYVEGVNI